MKLCCASEGQLPQVIELRRRAFSKLAPKFYSPIEVQNLLADYDAKQLPGMIAGQRLFCYLRDGDIVGTSGWDEDRLRHLYVDPDCFGLGIGTKLLQHTVADIQARTQQQTIQAGVILYARGFYEKCGFQVVSKKKAWDGSEYYLMRKDMA